jgi:long-chain acyl-CoA synthetase
VNWRNLKVSVGGGMAVQGAVAKLWLEKTGCPICEGYGLSETSPSATCNPVTNTEFTGTIGVPLPNTWLKCLDDDGARCHRASPARSPSRARRSWPATGSGPTKPPRS